MYMLPCLSYKFSKVFDRKIIGLLLAFAYFLEGGSISVQYPYISYYCL